MGSGRGIQLWVQFDRGGTTRAAQGVDGIKHTELELGRVIVTDAVQFGQRPPVCAHGRSGRTCGGTGRNSQTKGEKNENATHHWCIPLRLFTQLVSGPPLYFKRTSA